ncbi:sulfotransferase family protein [Maricaulis maris]|uniref:Sulfotransferase family protein n=1 Tax=Maricaulis maris TaxID=74318 RepID=A0A495D219_9PROT|nr:sulfotransferase [Maricaulis maris]RKQ95586.1 sulfotransferase family protein [Maricaulis maris]
MSDTSGAAARRDGAGLIFAGGCPRSGLTVLRRLIEPHRHVHCGPDTGLPPSIAMQWQNFARELGPLHARDFDLGAEDMRQSMAELLTGMISAPLDTPGVEVLVEKTSLNVAAFDPLGRLLPQARFIHVVRDGRDVANSLLARDWRDPQGRPFLHVSDPGAALKYWTDLTGIGLAAERSLAGRICRVRYEDLVTRPKATMTTLMTFLGFKFEPAQLHFATRRIELHGLEHDSVPLINQPLTRRRAGAGSALDGQVTAATRQRLTELGYGPQATAGKRRRNGWR